MALRGFKIDRCACLEEHRVAWRVGQDGGALDAAGLSYRLRSLPMAGAVLQVGAHPDDEDSGLLAYLAHGLGVRTVYWSATRGESRTESAQLVPGRGAGCVPHLGERGCSRHRRSGGPVRPLLRLRLQQERRRHAREVGKRCCRPRDRQGHSAGPAGDRHFSLERTAFRRAWPSPGHRGAHGRRRFGRPAIPICSRSSASSAWRPGRPVGSTSRSAATGRPNRTWRRWEPSGRTSSGKDWSA